MEFKIDTKEKFHVVHPIETSIYANMAADLTTQCSFFLKNETKNLILNLENTETIDETIATAIVKLQQDFFENKASFVVCSINNQIKNVFEISELFDSLNYAPTESEAWDIVQMEEIERELLDGEE